MFSVYNSYNSFLCWLYNSIILIFSYYYLFVLVVVLILFLSYRLPYIYSPFTFFVLLVCVVFSLFVSLFLSRLSFSVNIFFSGFIPVGTPMYICPIVCIAETISYIIRPVVLILRPFINISLGCFGAVALCNLCFCNYLWFIILFFVFFYEVFVAVVHWYIVTSILAFSVDH